MHAEVDTTKLFIQALEKGKPFSETTVFKCMVELKRSENLLENDDITLKWAQYYWSRYQAIGEHKLKSIAKHESQLIDLLYKHFGK